MMKAPLTECQCQKMSSTLPENSEINSVAAGYEGRVYGLAKGGREVLMMEPGSSSPPTVVWNGTDGDTR